MEHQLMLSHNGNCHHTHSAYHGDEQAVGEIKYSDRWLASTVSPLAALLRLIRWEAGALLADSNDCQ
jgi:hypothetical protein